ncbi:MAG: septal ring lytic transglycosylase RlpA family protein [Comamonadaceae bacterium]|nr:MAG: septal ring lytic transglycosylase RlpA family protein [Comamonadaceae bacterium]
MRLGRAALVLGCCLLAACTTQPPAAEEGVAASAAANATSAPRPRLRPLAPGLAVPAGAAPRSLVPAVNYELTSTGDLPPDDGVPGDEGPREIFERGGASWYGIQFHQRKTANGERFDMGAYTAAHKTLPFNTRVCVRSLVNGKEVLVRINDRGPYAQGRVIDLSRAAADQIGLISMGIKQVALSVVDHKGQRCGGAAVNLDDAPAAAEPLAKPVARRVTRKAASRRR